MKVGMVGGEAKEFVVRVNVSFSAVAEDQRELFPLMTSFLSQQPMQHRAKRCDPGAGGDENRIPHRRAEGKVAKRPLTGNLGARFHVAKIIRREAILYAVQAEREAVVFTGRRSDRIGARDFFAVGLGGFE